MTKYTKELYKNFDNYLILCRYDNKVVKGILSELVDTLGENTKPLPYNKIAGKINVTQALICYYINGSNTTNGLSEMGLVIKKFDGNLIFRGLKLTPLGKHVLDIINY